MSDKISPKDEAKASPTIEKELGVAPMRFGGKPIRLLLMSKFANGWVATDHKDLPIDSANRQAIYRKRGFDAQFTVETSQISYYDALEEKHYIFFDKMQNAPLKTEFNQARDSKSSQLVAQYGAQENFRQFIAGIRAQIKADWRRTAITAIVFLIVGVIIRTFI